jgi:2',3'-cyclic-nucleotide 2'-phosphodiesterase (5'-nucleotidase family)
MQVWGSNRASTGGFKKNLKTRTAQKPFHKGISHTERFKRPLNTDVINFAGKNTKEKPLTLIYMADTHKSLDLMANLKTAISENKQTTDGSVVLHAGDYAMGNEGIDLQVKLLNKLGIDYATLGNHEFFSGPEKLASALENSEFKTVISNLKIDQDNPLKRLENKGKMVTSEVKTIQGKKYGFIGAVTRSINTDSYKDYTSGIKALDPFIEINRQVQELEKQGVNRIILISHMGYNLDKSIARSIPGIDVIAGGHTHIALPEIKKNINLFNSSGRGEPVLILHAGAYAEALGVSHLVFNDQGILQINPVEKSSNKYIRALKNLFKIDADKALNKHKFTDNHLIDVSEYPKDRQVYKIVEKIHSKMHKISTIKKPIDGNWPIWGTSEIGCLTADAVKNHTESQISLIHPGCIRRGIDKGNIYAEYIKDHVLPFNTSIVKVELSGRNIFKALNKGASCTGHHKKPGIVQVSGLKYAIDMNRHENARIPLESIFVNINGQYEPLDLNKKYVVAYDEYLLKAGDDFKSLKDAKILEHYQDTCYADALIKHLIQLEKNNEPLSSDFSDRIVIKNQPQEESFIDKILHKLGLLKKSRIDKFVLKGQERIL